MLNNQRIIHPDTWTMELPYLIKSQFDAGTWGLSYLFGMVPEPTLWWQFSSLPLNMTI
jgi:hypothetical protein